MRCRHCGSDCGASHGDSHGAYSSGFLPDMPFSDFKRAISPLAESGGRKPSSVVGAKSGVIVVITGGEPLVREDIAECGSELRDIGFAWGLVSNGWLYTQDMHERLFDAGLGAITLSVDGLEANHDWLRGTDGSFERVKRAIALLARDSPSRGVFFDVVTCVHKRNLRELPALKTFLYESGVRRWRLFTIAPIGRAARDAELQLSGEEVKTLFEFISDSRKENLLNVTLSCEAYTGKYETQVRDAPFFCKAGVNIASILIDGSISACPNIDRAFAQGNISTDSLLDVWQTRFKDFRDRKWMKTGVCASCKDWRDCLGGGMHLRSPKEAGPKVCLNRILQAGNS